MTITLKQKEYSGPVTGISVVTAGTSDIPVAEEAAVTAEFYNNKVERFYDIEAGIHRLQGNIERLRQHELLLWLPEWKVLAKCNWRLGR
ncbi:MAG: hypothetical protein R2764_24195 [Bacteroidales bacterium]